ncbi:MAG TPA: HAMP domain-containing sensor histidine kinase, partial [Thermoanaerobaculia bacterium]|nr:HAMP domain-containing sensor histidine kinase [Thermoanaerobaculia bacterium]
MAQAASVVPSIGPVLHPSRTRLRCYGSALAAVAAATLVRWLLQPWLGTDAPFSIHYGAIIFAAWYGGLGPGIVSTLLSAAAVHLLLDGQLGGPADGAGDALWTLLFLATGVITSYVSEALHVARCRIDSAAAELRAGLAEVEHARRDAEEASRVKDEFLATLSHELRTPLTAILGWAHLLQTGRAQDRLDTGLETIARNARQQAQLIDDVLDLSRIVTGKLRFETRPVQPIEPVVAAIQTLLPTIQAKGIALRQELDPEAGPVAGDRDRLQQVVWNLLANAVKFTPAGGTVEVRLAERGESVEIAVADSGEGIPAEDLPHVFERFWQRDSSSRRRHGGLG